MPFSGQSRTVISHRELSSKVTSDRKSQDNKIMEKKIEHSFVKFFCLIFDYRKVEVKLRLLEVKSLREDQIYYTFPWESDDEMKILVRTNESNRSLAA